MLREEIEYRPTNGLELKGRVLVVDDDLQDLYSYAATLQQEGFSVRVCDSFNEGDRLLQKNNFDFVILAQGGCEFEGRHLLERVIEKDRSIPALVITRCHSMDAYLDAMQMGAVDYLEKPLRPAELARVVETHLKPKEYRITA